MKIPTLNNIALFGGLGLAALTGSFSSGNAAILAPALMGILGWWGGMAGNQVHALLRSICRLPEPEDAEAVLISIR